MVSRATICIICLALILSFITRVDAQDYTFEIRASTNTPMGNIEFKNLYRPSLNNKGQVAFSADFREDYQDKSGVFIDDTLVVQSGDIIEGREFYSNHPEWPNSGLSLNDRKQVAYYGRFEDYSEGILVNKKLAVYQDMLIGDKALENVSAPSINNVGGVAFIGGYSGGGAIFTQKKLVAGQESKFAWSGFGVPSINDSGVVSFYGRREYSAWETYSGIYRKGKVLDYLAWPGKTIACCTLSDTGLTKLAPTAIDNKGEVAFYGEFSDGAGILTQNSLLARTGTVIGGTTVSEFIVNSNTSKYFTITMNDSGQVAFPAKCPTGYAIFTQSTLVAKAGDTINGLKLTRTFGYHGYPSINNKGQVAFIGYLEDDQEHILGHAVIVATPKEAGAYTVSGRVTKAKSGVEDVIISLTGKATICTATDPDGNYRISGLTKGNYELTASKTGHTFTPAIISVTVDDADEPEQNFYEKTGDGRPGPPTGVKAKAGNAQATVSFVPPASDGGSPITFYTVTSFPEWITKKGTASPITVTGLTNGKTYRFTVKATNAIGAGPASKKSNAVTPKE